MVTKIKNTVIYISVLVTFTIILLIAVEFSCGLFFNFLPLLSSIYSHGRVNNYADCRVESPGYTDKTYANEIYKEYSLLKSRYLPYTIWAFKEFHGKHININKDGLRATIPGNIKNPAKRIFFFGGSTMWGVGVDDADTIPSIISKYLNKDNPVAFEVTNYGRIGYVSTQELMQLILELLRGNKPDVVIFYDGINDIYASVFSPGIASYHENYEQIKDKMEAKGLLRTAYFNSNFYNLVDYIKNRFRRTVLSQGGVEDEKIKKAIDSYAANLELAQGLAEKYGFKFIAFCQPVIFFEQKELTPYEKIEKIKVGEKLNRIYVKAYENISKRDFSGIKFVNLAGIFASEKEDIYIDFAHFTNNGNTIVAKKILEQIRENGL